jgi:hypothetical protein
MGYRLLQLAFVGTGGRPCSQGTSQHQISLFWSAAVVSNGTSGIVQNGG